MKKYLLFLVLSVALLPTSVWGQANLSQIDSLIKRMLPEASEVGISVYDLTAKKSLYTYRDTKLSRPASTMKLLTAITALSRPDADNPFRTEVWHDGVIEHDTLQGNLYVVGGFVDRSVNKVIVAIVLLSRTRAPPGPANSEFRRGDCH